MNNKLGRFKNLIESKYGTDYEVSGSEMIYDCPYCPQYKEGKKFYVNSVKGVYQCFRCGVQGRLTLDKDSKLIIDNDYDLARLCNEYVNQDVVDQNFSKVYVEIPKFRVVDYPNSVPFNYLKSRGITEANMDYYNIRVFSELIKFHNRIIFPNKIINQNWTDFFTARAIFSDMIPRYLNSQIISKSEIVFNLHRIEENSEIIINEGIINSIIAGSNSIAILGKYCSNIQFKLIMNKKPKSIVISLDYDALEQAYQLADRFLRAGVTKVSIVHLPNQEDASTLGSAIYRQYVEDAEDYSIKGQLVSSILDLI